MLHRIDATGLTPVVLGDVHGAFEKLMCEIDRRQMTDVVIFCVGDFGFSINVGYELQTPEKYGKMLHKYNTIFAKRNILFLSIRGNHDNPAYFRDGTFMLSNLRLVHDYTVVDTDAGRWLLAGGALSIDRIYLQGKANPDSVMAKAGKLKDYTGKKWWPDEAFVFDKDKLQEAGQVEVVVTHSAPSGVVTGMFSGSSSRLRDVYNDGDTNIYADLQAEQDAHENLLEEMQNAPPAKWYYGHFHLRHENVYRGVSFRCVDILEMVEHRL